LSASTTTVAQTDSVIPASNPANVPILKESRNVNKPVAVSYDGRHGGVYEGDKIEQGVEMSPLGRKEDLNINIGVSSGDYPFVVSDVKEPTPTTIKKGETIISSETRIKPGKKQPASVTATTTEVKSWMKSKAVQRAIKAGTVLSSFPFIGELFTPLEIAQAHDTVIKPRQEKYGGSGLASGRDRDYGKVFKEEGKRDITPYEEFKNWKEWDAVKGFSAWAKNRSLTARSLRR
jgi:hypothetical protein